MHMPIHKTAEKQNPSKVVTSSERKSNVLPAVQFTDNRPEAIVQRRLLVLSENYTPAKQVTQVQAINDHDQRTPVQKKENKTGLPDQLKNGIENLSGYNMEDVRVHYGSPKPAQLNAHAYAQGTDIHVASGQERHLPHEAWHVVQQKQGRVRPTLQMKEGVHVNDDAGLEKEADVMGLKAMQFSLDESAHSEGLKKKGSQLVAQRWLKHSLFYDQNRPKKTYFRTKEIYGLGFQYNLLQKRKKISREFRLNKLHNLQIALLKFLDAPDMPDQNISETLLWAKEMLNDVQEEHEYLISQSIVANDPKPPIANFDNLPEQKQKVITELWDKLVQGTGNIQITEDEARTDQDKVVHTRTHVGFKNKVLAQFARLLETTTGLEIITQLSEDTKGKKQITIKPGLSTASDGFSVAEPAAGPAMMDGRDKLVEINLKDMYKNQRDARRKRERYSRNFVTLDFAAMKDVKERSAAIYNVRKNYKWAKGVKVGQKYYKFGSGTAVNVTLTPDVTDAVDHATSRFVDSNKNEIPTPNYITLGHELGHAVHMQTGTALGEDNTTMSLFDHVAPGLMGPQKAEWSDIEEYSNINHVENAIRSEYGMKSRHGHINQKWVQARRLDRVEGELYRIGTLLPNDRRGTYNDQRAQLITDSGANNIGDYRTHAVALINYLSQQLDFIFPRFTPLEINSIRAILVKAEKGTASTKEDEMSRAVIELQAAYDAIDHANQRVAQLPPLIESQAPSVTSKVMGWVGSFFR